MKIKKIWFNEEGETLIEKDLEARICWNEKPMCVEIILNDECASPREAIYIDYEKLLMYLKRGKK